jgi:two-component system sensor histidine kinase ChvG
MIEWRRRGRRHLSPLTLRILAVNVVTLLFLGAGLLAIDRYEADLVNRELAALRLQARLIATAIAEGALDETDPGAPVIDPGVAQMLVRRLAAQPAGRIRLFDADGNLVTDSTLLVGAAGQIEVRPLAPTPTSPPWPLSWVEAGYEWAFHALPRRDSYPRHADRLEPHAAALPEAAGALDGEATEATYVDLDGHLVFTMGEPVQRLRLVHGAVVLERRSDDLDIAVRGLRAEMLRWVATALVLIVLLSLWLAGTIARPIRHLAVAADRVRDGRGRGRIPDLTHRHDEIGDLSGALAAMTHTLWRRLEGTERFAADVAHELKNPLTSLRSAAEAIRQITDPARRDRLLGLLLADVQRLDRLVSDIATASRVDAEMVRAEPEPVDLAAMLRALVEVHEAAARPVPLTLTGDPARATMVAGMADRLGQVFRNLIDNALSFTPDGGAVRLILDEQPGRVLVHVDDDGPGLPDGAEERIFERFYSDRPAREDFGTHSGLGLSIARQIVEAHAGRLTGETRIGRAGERLGARFTVDLPAASR